MKIQNNTLLDNLKNLIEQTKKNVAVQVNSSLTLMYWNIGKKINDNVLQNGRADYGKEIVATLSQQLQKEYGRGYAKRNLADMIKFSQIFCDFPILQALSAKFTWTHFKTFIYIEDSIKRDFYVEMTKLERWSTRILSKQIDSMLYERTALSKKPAETIKYELDKLKRLVVIELKIGKFKASHKGQMELYLKWLEKYEKEDGEKSPIGIILCADKKSEQIELLELDKSNIHVAQYLTVLPSKEKLEAKLHQALINAREKYNVKD